MTQKELNQAIAEATGESVETISSIGFSIEMFSDIDENQISPCEKSNIGDVP